MNASNTTRSPQKDLPSWIYFSLLILILLGGAYFRFIGINWGDEQYLHPDERFLVWVGSDISPVKSAGEYFNTAISSLNPHNRGHGFFVYGTLPLFITRYLVEWIFGHSGFMEMTEVGRPLSAGVDLLALLLVAAIAERLYNRRSSLLAATFYSLAVLPIQLSHFFKEDTFLNFFVLLAVYLAVLIATSPIEERDLQEIQAGDVDPEGLGYTADSLNVQVDEINDGSRSWKKSFQFLDGVIRSQKFWLSVAFGAALACAVASKLTAVPVAVLLPGAFVILIFSARSRGAKPGEVRRLILIASISMFTAGLVSFLIFRVAQPYAFQGPTFFNIAPNPAWVANIQEQRNQSTGDVDFPPALQWARRSVWFSGQNLVIWGLGLPLGILAWAGFLLAGWRMFNGDWQQHALLWGWTAIFFTWQSSLNNPTMRYQLPVYPGLAVFAGWFIVFLWYGRQKKTEHPIEYVDDKKTHRGEILRKTLSVCLGIVGIFGTLAWAYAFTRIYTRPVTRVAASRWIYQNIPGPLNLHIQTETGLYNQPLSFPYDKAIQLGQSSSGPAEEIIYFEAKADGLLSELYIAHAFDPSLFQGQKKLAIEVSSGTGQGGSVKASIVSDFFPIQDPRGEEFLVVFDEPLPLTKGVQYKLTLTLVEGVGTVTFYGASPANESSWDDGLPLRMDGLDGYGGIYQRDLVFELYWDDNTDKLSRIIGTLDQADYIFISSNRQWGTTTRIPERYPLTIAYYRYLLGCPPEKDVIWCYNVARPSVFQSELGFDLVKVFESYPTLGQWEINDQFAEEAFTVYDHPKVLIFKKNQDYDPRQVRQLLGSIDLSKVIHLTPLQADKHPGLLLLPADRWVEQQAGGTWSELFNTENLINRNQVVGVLVWYLFIAALGWLVYPLVRLIFSALPDRGYPIARVTGLLVLSYFVWLGGSFRIPFTRATIGLVLLLIGLASSAAVYWHRVDIRQEWRERKKYYLLVEGLFLAFFVLDLLIRIGNPDLWHPWKGGEKPMDFAYFNAVLKSTSFPPYDPWYAGGYLNYYYYGFVLMGTPVKLLGVTPAVAYNLILPTVFSLIALGAFSLGSNLVHHQLLKEQQARIGDDDDGIHPVPSNFLLRGQLWAGLAAALGMAVLGNLGTVRMIFQGYQKAAAPGGVVDGANLLLRLLWTVQGIAKVTTGQGLPYGLGDWYWNPSRAIPALNDVEPITEFPFFTVLYGDPHAHLFALPLTLLALACILAFVLQRNILKGWPTVGRLLFAGLVVGALRPTNTWDFYPFLALGAVAILFGVWMAPRGQDINTLEDEVNPAKSLHTLWNGIPITSRLVIKAGLAVALFVVSAHLIYQPYAEWFGLGYSKIELWKGTHTPMGAYLTHWGLFIFLIVSWMSWETYQWMATTPVSALRKLKPNIGLLELAGLLLLGTILGLWIFLDVSISWFVLLNAAWAGILLLRPGQEREKQFVLFLVGTGLVLTLMVEVIVLRGDIGRMNTVFKFYLQVWSLFAVSAAASLGWLLSSLAGWNRRFRGAWQLILGVLLFSAALYPLLGGLAKIKDRMMVDGPHTLDGMAYMETAEYAERWGVMDLGQDYRAILWMLENVKGSPVIVEANLRDLYRWGSRFSINTGLPGVVGWEWHEQQQRTLLPGTWVSDRIAEVDNFYSTTDLQIAHDFLKKYNVKYIVMGQQERGHYPGPGLDKFPAANGVLWLEVYRELDTVIYEVKQP